MPHQDILVTQEIRFATAEIHISPWDAEVSRALLESEGVRAFLCSDHHVYVQWPMSLALGGVRVMVPAECLSLAREVFALRDQGVLQDALSHELHDGESSVPCWSCGGAQFQMKLDKVSALLAVLSLIFWSAPFPPGKVQKCRYCGAGASQD